MILTGSKVEFVVFLDGAPLGHTEDDTSIPPLTDEEEDVLMCPLR